MNQYQEFILPMIKYELFIDKDCREKANNDIGNLSSKKIIIKQAEDYHITEYFLSINLSIDYAIDHKFISYIICNNEQYQINNNLNTFVIPIDFNKRINSIEIHFLDNIIDSFIIPLEYIEANKEIFDKKVDLENRHKLEENAQIKYSVGNDLVNIYFAPCSEECNETQIILFLGKKENNKFSIVQKLASYKIDKDTMFKSIDGLAKGYYGFTLSQYDKSNNLLFTCEPKFFSISINNTIFKW